MKNLLAMSLALAGLALPATAQEKPGTQYYRVECTTQSEQCNNAAKIRLPSGEGSWTLSLTAPTEHCSDIQYVIKQIEYRPSYGAGLSRKRYKTIKLAEIWRSNWLSAGTSDSYNFMSSSAPALYIMAEGRAGGCNQGILASWGVAVQLTAN